MDSDILDSLVMKEQSDTLTVKEILQAEPALLHDPELKNKKWKVFNSCTGVQYIYCNGQLLPIMKNNSYLIR